MPPGPALLESIKAHRDAIVESLRAIVEHESPSHDKGALDSLAAKLAAELQDLGAEEVDLLPNQLGGEHVRARFAGDSTKTPGLVVGHYDTVWPVGTLATMPFKVEGDLAFGPGVFDMKASFVLVAAALRAVRDLGLALPRPVTILFTSDEETGSEQSRALIEEEAKQSAYALVVEPPLMEGGLKTGRKGTGHFTLTVEGRSAHAGVEPEKGRSAIVELAHQVVGLQALARPELGTTVNVGLISGGSTSNVIPARATAVIDARVKSMDEATRLDAEFRLLRPVTPDVKLVVSGGIERPPMERTEAVAGLFARIVPIGATLGLSLTEGSTGGASDGNFTAALGVPTVDGLGCPGQGAHAVHEQVSIDGLIERAALMAACLLEL